jgi:anti-anti-sigma factor
VGYYFTAGSIDRGCDVAISVMVPGDGQGATIKVIGRFDFGAHKEFRNAYSQFDPRATKIVLDLSGADYMDSAALGMLLVLRERAGGDAADITLKGCSAEIQKILDVSRFAELFTIE